MSGENKDTNDLKSVPEHPRIYHIVHFDRLAQIIRDGFLYSDEYVMKSTLPGTVIGYNHIKQRRLVKPVVPGGDLKVGGCVPFYYCPRSVMLYVIWKRNHSELMYRGGQDPILHLVFDPFTVAEWAKSKELRYYVTDVTAASEYFDAREDIDAIWDLDWNAIQATQWQEVTARKQAEFLVEREVPISLACGIGVCREEYRLGVEQMLKMHGLYNAIPVNVRRDWYY